MPFLRSLDNESIDLVVIDPPFGKNQTFVGRLRPELQDDELEHEYDLLASWGVQNEYDAYDIGIEFPDQSGTTAQFRDIWDFRFQVEKADWDRIDQHYPAARHLIEATRFTHSESTAAYIAFMTLRMIEIHRILRHTGSVYLHCDSEANAYLRQMMDSIFAPINFRNEIIWRRQFSNNAVTSKYGNVTDTILFYNKSSKSTWNQQYGNRSKSELSEYKKDCNGRLFKAQDLTAPGRDPSRMFEWRGTTPSRNWAFTLEGLEKLWQERRILCGKNGKPRQRGRIQYLDELPNGTKLQNLWDDVPRLGNTAKERTGYPTQKPQALARRIIEASSNPGDLVLDCFAGCAYVPVAAELTGRNWIACDMSPRAWTVVRRQFEKHPDLGIKTEGKRISDTIELKLDKPGALIQVRGPHDLPNRTTEDPPVNAMLRDKDAPVFRQKALESSKSIWEAFVDHWGPNCWYCGVETREDRRVLELDHVEPRDGTNDDCWNRALACPPCNSDKTDKLTPVQTIEKAFESNRIASQARRDELKEQFEKRREWTLKRYNEEVVHPQLPM